MADACSNCAARLSFSQKLLGKTLCSACSNLQSQARSNAEAQYKTVLQSLVTSDELPAEEVAKLPALAQQAGFNPSAVSEMHVQTLRSYVERALSDEHLTPDEESRIDQLAAALGITDATITQRLTDFSSRVLIARLNDGRIPSLPQPHILLKKGEVAHLETNTDLLKEVAHKEYRGRYQGVSFRVMKGVRYYTGASRGKMVVVGTSLEAADRGMLTITSQRSVFTGSRQSIEMPHSKLLNLTLYTDGVQFHLSNRKNPPLFRLKQDESELVAAVVNAAGQKQVT